MAGSAFPGGREQWYIGNLQLVTLVTTFQLYKHREIAVLKLGPWVPELIRLLVNKMDLVEITTKS